MDESGDDHQQLTAADALVGLVVASLSLVGLVGMAGTAVRFIAAWFK